MAFIFSGLAIEIINPPCLLFGLTYYCRVFIYILVQSKVSESVISKCNQPDSCV